MKRGIATSAAVFALPDPAERLERQLRDAWSKEDALAEQAREARQTARALERQVAQAYGYGSFVRREALELAMNRPKLAAMIKGEK